MKQISLWMIVAMLVATVGIYAASISGTTKTLGGTGAVTVGAPATTVSTAYTLDASNNVSAVDVHVDSGDQQQLHHQRDRGQQHGVSRDRDLRHRSEDGCRHHLPCGGRRCGDLSERGRQPDLGLDETSSQATPLEVWPVRTKVEKHSCEESEKRGVRPNADKRARAWAKA